MKRTWLSIIMTVILSLSFAITAYAANESEDNNTMDSATSISVNESVYGSIGDKNDKDWYRVYVPSDGAVSFQFEHTVLSSTNTYWEMYLYQSDGVTPIYGKDTYWNIPGNENRTTAEMGLPAGTYYIKILPYSSSRYDTSTYTLRVNHTASSVWETEINNTTTDADMISVNTDYYGSICGKNDVDWYAVTVPENGYVTFQFNHTVLSSTNTYWEMYLYRSDGVTPIYGKDTYWNIPGNENRTTAEMGLPAGTYYIKILPYSSDRYETSAYTLRVNHTASSVWETEINNTTTDADMISVNTDYYGSICGKNDVDWYAVTVPENGYASFQFNHTILSSTNTYWEMYLYQSDGVTPIYGKDTYWNIYGNENKTTAEIGLSAGTYYIKILPYSSDRYETSAYTLRVNHTASSVWETEINNTSSDADMISVNTDYSGSICGKNDVDWFTFELKAAAEITLNFSHASNGNSSTYWEAYFYSSDGVSEICDMLNIPGDNLTASYSLGELGAGRYYLKILPYSGDRYDTATYTLHLGEKHDHAFTIWTTTQEPTCTEYGTSESSCDICGYVSTDSIVPTGHNYGEWIIDKQPQCDAEGAQSCKCLTCGDIQTEAIEMIPHNYGESVHVSGSKLSSPIVYHETCRDCGHVQVIEDDQYAWILPAIIIACILFVALIIALVVFKNRKKIFKTHFVCPYCFETHKMSEAQFRCSNNLCKDVPDIEMTQYENGDIKMPKQGKITFTSADVQKGEKAIPKSAVCPECHRTTHKVICPSCHNLLPESALLGDDMIISIVGSRDTGKSHFVGVIINELIERIAPAFGGSFEGFDDTMDRYEQSFGRKLYVDLQKLDLTQSSLQNVNNGAYRPLIFSLKFRIKKGAKETINRYTLVFFDTAGEDLDDADTMSTVNKYICKSAGIIFLLDPMKIPAVATQLDDDTVSRASSVDWRRSTRSDDILVRVSNLIRNDRALKSSDKIDIPVAVVFSKFDAIEPIIPKGCAILNNSPHCKEKAFVLSDWHNVNSEVQGLLRTWGAESFLSQLDVNYTDFSCFAVSSLGLNNNPTADLKINRPRPHRIEDPLLWILMKLKVIKSKK